MGLHHLVKEYDPACVGAIWDPSHNALQGEDAVTGLEIVQSHLCMVNLKNAFWKRVNGPEVETAEWRPYFTSGRHGLASWAQVAEGVRKVGYRGHLTLSAEYSAEREVNRLIVEDLAYAQELFG
jgi:sugar phosphate isomerase/epimerase